MLTVACVEWGDFLGRGAEYVTKLKSMVARHLKAPHRFICFTEDDRRHGFREGVELFPLMPGQVGWWNKLQLFRPGVLGGRVMYLDLDTVITGPLDELALHKGAVQLRDWGWDRDVSAGGTLVWDAGEHAEVWEGAPDAPGRFEDDQVYLNSFGLWPRLPAHLVRSYRYHSKAAPPPGCVAVGFHGRPKPHEVTTGWVPQLWT